MRKFKPATLIFSVLIILGFYVEYLNNHYLLGKPINFIFLAFSLLLILNIISFFAKGIALTPLGVINEKNILTKKETVSNIQAGFNNKLSIGFFVLSLSLAKIFFDLQSLYWSLVFLCMAVLTLFSYFYWIKKENIENMAKKISGVSEMDYSYIIKNIVIPIGATFFCVWLVNSALMETYFNIPILLLALVFLAWVLKNAIFLFRKDKE